MKDILRHPARNFRVRATCTELEVIRSCLFFRRPDSRECWYVCKCVRACVPSEIHSSGGRQPRSAGTRKHGLSRAYECSGSRALGRSRIREGSNRGWYYLAGNVEFQNLNMKHARLNLMGLGGSPQGVFTRSCDLESLEARSVSAITIPMQ